MDGLRIACGGIGGGGRILAAAATMLAGVGTLPEIAHSDKYDLARWQRPGLFKVYYQEAVMEYCGLLTRETRQGFEWQVEDMLAASPTSEDEHRNVRVAGNAAADLQYDNHGLGGQRGWCRGEGLAAFFRFFDLFRSRNWSRSNRGGHSERYGR